MPPRLPYVLAALAALGALACVPSLRTSFREGSGLTERSLDAAALRVVDLDAAVGDVELTAIDADSVRVHVALRSSDADRLATECIPRSSLEAEERDGVLTLRVRQETRNQCGTRWRVGVPARLGARVRADVGNVTITGLAAGVDVDVRNGDVKVTSRAPGHGAVSVRSDVGKVQVRIAGYDVPQRAQHGAGAEVRLKGPGGPDITLRTGVGSAALTIEGARPQPER